jgi:hypothetical protein
VDPALPVFRQFGLELALANDSGMRLFFVLPWAA